ncbi:phosphoesterase [Lacisediminihabitans profunda]|uniref:Phosphoesterase n=2 Tax=Lacisediminihabitans profunda TaxID=2594790 RepID=A0A5C8UXP6_9MICO|nr:phosphoesterase [Lacisediminihabitans profunda]
MLTGAVLTGCTTAAPKPVGGSESAPAPSVSPSSGVVSKVLVIVVENHSLDQMTAQMTYTFGLATTFGYATRYAAIRHPSLPNYIALVGGQTYGITDDASPSANEIRSGASVFGQAIAAGKTAALFAEGMPGNCALANGGDHYAVKHNPWAYFAAERSLCGRYDVPIGGLGATIAAGTLPTVGMVLPNLCNDAHDCPLGTADTWIRGWMEKLFAGPDWASGHLAVLITADENDDSPGNTVLTVVVHPSQRAHVVTTPLSHYSVTRLLEDVAGVPHLFGAAAAPSLSSAFALPIGASP